VLEYRRPGKTVTLCLPLFLAGNEGERNFARTHPTITVDGCDKQCAKWATELHSGPVSSALVVTEVVGETAVDCPRSGRAASPARDEAVRVVAERIAAEVDAVLARLAAGAGQEPAQAAAIVERPEQTAGTQERAETQEPAGVAEPVCSCMQSLPSGVVVVDGREVEVCGLPLVFDQLTKKGVRGEESDARQILELTKVFQYVPPEEEEAYRGALLEAYRAFLRQQGEVRER